MILTKEQKDALIMMAKCQAVDMAVKDILAQEQGCEGCGDLKAKYYMIVMLVKTLLCTPTCVDENKLYEKLYELINICDVDDETIDFPSQIIPSEKIEGNLVILLHEDGSPVLNEDGGYIFLE